MDGSKSVHLSLLDVAMIFYRFVSVFQFSAEIVYYAYYAFVSIITHSLSHIVPGRSFRSKLSSKTILYTDRECCSTCGDTCVWGTIMFSHRKIWLNSFHRHKQYWRIYKTIYCGATPVIFRWDMDYDCIFVSSSDNFSLWMHIDIIKFEWHKRNIFLSVRKIRS